MSGIELKTIEIMIDNGFHSVHSLLAIKVDTDLNQIPDLLLGQKSILREALQDLQNEYKELKFKLKIDNSFTRRLLEESLINDHISTPNESPKSTSKQILKKTESQKVVKTIEDKIQTISEKLGLRSAKKQKKATNSDQNISSLEPEITITPGTAHSEEKCGVCGRSAKRMRCRQQNGIICMICLEFYTYNYEKRDQLVCHFEDKCFINKNTKSNCRRCRWNQCLEIIGSDKSVAKVSLPSAATITADEESFDQFMETNDYVNQSQPYISLTPIKLPPKSLNKPKTCKVCGDRVSKSKHNNYGVVSCVGCASFFRRVNKKEIIITECIESDKCIINPMTRNKCKSCRYQACHMSGMIYNPKHKDNATKKQEEEPIDGNEEQDIEEEEVMDYSSDVNASTGSNYTLIHCGRTPDSPLNQKKSQTS